MFCLAVLGFRVKHAGGFDFAGSLGIQKAAPLFYARLRSSLCVETRGGSSYHCTIKAVQRSAGFQTRRVADFQIGGASGCPTPSAVGNPRHSGLGGLRYAKSVRVIERT